MEARPSSQSLTDLAYPSSSGTRSRAGLLVVAAVLSCSPPPPGPAGDDLLGTWSAVLEHAGARGELVLRFEPDEGEEDGGLRAWLSLPTIDAWDAVALPVRRAGDRVDLGLFTLHREGDGLAGELPEALVPVHRIPFTLHRSEDLSPPAPEPIVAETVEPLWTRDLGSPIWAAAAISDDLLFVGTEAGDLAALDTASGATRWRFETGGAIRARATLGEGALYVSSDDGFLYALDARSGRSLWRVRLQEEEIDRIPPGSQGSRYDHYASAARRSGDAVFVASHAGTLIALDAANGAVRWRFATGDIVTSTPAVAEGSVLFGGFDGRVYALDAASGGEIWRFDTGAAVPSSPAVAGGLVVVGSRSYDLFALGLESGRPAWTHYLWYSWVESSPSIDGGTVFVGSSDAQVVSALDLSSGALRWRFDSGGSVWSQPAVTEDAVYVGSVGVADYMVDHRGGLFALDRDDGTVRWTVPVERPEGVSVWGFAASPVLGDGRLFVGGLDGLLYAFPLRPL